MAKKRQTTGLPRSTRKQSTPEEETKGRGGVQREYRSRSEREAEYQRLVLLGTGAAVGLVVIILLIAFVFDQVITPRQTVVTVNGESVSVGQFEERVRLERLISIQLINDGINEFLDFGFTTDPNEAFNQLLQNDQTTNRLWNELSVNDQLGLRVIEDIVNDRLIRQEAEARDITVTDEEIQREVDELFGFDREIVTALINEETPEPEETTTVTPTPFVSPTPSLTPTITPTVEITATPTATAFPTVAPPPTLTGEQQLENHEESIDDFYSEIRSVTGMSTDDINRYFETRALARALSTVIADSGDMGTYVNSRHILVETEEEALDIIDALNNGESFAALAQALSTDTSSGARGGELDWAPVFRYVEEFANAVETAPIGEITGPIESDFGFHIIQVREREERELDEAQIEAQQSQEFSTWLEELRDSEETEVETNSIWTSHVPDDPVFVYEGR